MVLITCNYSIHGVYEPISNVWGPPQTVPHLRQVASLGAVGPMRADIDAGATAHVGMTQGTNRYLAVFFCIEVTWSNGGFRSHRATPVM